MRIPTSGRTLEEFGRIRLSKNFFMREFLHSEISQIECVPNIPDDPDLAIAAGTKLCTELLEPLQSEFGRIAIRSAYRSVTINALGVRKPSQYSCAQNEANYAKHIWDRRDANGFMGAMACIVLPGFIDRYENGSSWRVVADWIDGNLNYSELCFYPKLCAFNIGWHERPVRTIRSYIRK